MHALVESPIKIQLNSLQINGYQIAECKSLTLLHPLQLYAGFLVHISVGYLSYPQIVIVILHAIW